MIARDGERMLVSGAVTLDGVAALLEQGRTQILDGARVVDLAGVTELDSSALAMLLAWMRQAKSCNRELALVGFPEGLTAIARLYGVDGLLTAAQPDPANHH
ncbi:MAG: STAS domain-containing protein [Betaproteobacteria bacterium]|nr:STAS domain-containing protein [Betaproteobacteria bacterium]